LITVWLKVNIASEFKNRETKFELSGINT